MEVFWQEERKGSNQTAQSIHHMMWGKKLRKGNVALKILASTISPLPSIYLGWQDKFPVLGRKEGVYAQRFYICIFLIDMKQTIMFFWVARETQTFIFEKM